MYLRTATNTFDVHQLPTKLFRPYTPSLLRTSNSKCFIIWLDDVLHALFINYRNLAWKNSTFSIKIVKKCDIKIIQDILIFRRIHINSNQKLTIDTKLIFKKFIQFILCWFVFLLFHYSKCTCSTWRHARAVENWLKKLAVHRKHCSQSGLINHHHQSKFAAAIQFLFFIFISHIFLIFYQPVLTKIEKNNNLFY